LAVMQRTKTGLRLRSLAMSSDSSEVLVGAEDGLHFRSIHDISQENREPITSHAFNVNAVTVADRLGILWAAENRVFLTRFDTNHSTKIVWSDSGAILSISYNSGSILFGGEDRTIYFESLEERHKMTGHRADVRDIAVFADGRLIASLSADGQIIIWRIHSGTVLSRFSIGTKKPVSFCALGNSRDIAILTDDGYL